MSIEVHIATPADREAVLALLVAQLRDHGIATPGAEIAGVVDLLLERPHRGRLLLAWDGARPVGVAAVSFGFPLEHGGRGAWLEELYVEPAARGRGTGTRLLEAALEEASRGGAVAIDLEVERGHEAVERLYERHGFVPLVRTRWARRLGVAAEAGPPPPQTMRGGCFCGAVRYEIDGAPRQVSHCHCSMCRRTAGAPVVTWATYPLAAVRWTHGTPATLRSSPPATRRFCSTCGTALAFHTAEEPEWIDVTVASMDDAASLWPDEHVWYEDRLPWLALDDDLPRWPRGQRD
ncbi:MAG TPA: GNAT family N-acetyltransferase [Candidatus Limnocylindria bacterium]|nr:GNAT family N-acetyltransferase [Candidatus Limnocylindria bacterium]